MFDSFALYLDFVILGMCLPLLCLVFSKGCQKGRCACMVLFGSDSSEKPRNKRAGLLRLSLKIVLDSCS